MMIKSDYGKFNLISVLACESVQELSPDINKERGETIKAADSQHNNKIHSTQEDWVTQTVYVSTVTGSNPALNQIHMFTRWWFLVYLGFPESQTWPHRPIHVIITIMSYLISTSDSHLSVKVSPLTHELLYIIQHSFTVAQLLPPCIMDQRVIWL